MKVAVIIPTYNEEKAIAKVVRGFRAAGFSDIYVIDGFSTDRTTDVAKASGALVINRDRHGKGDAIRTALRKIEADVYVISDGDGTYDPKEARKLLDLLKDKKAHMAVGVRDRQNVGWFNSIGNAAFNMFLWFAYNKRFRDTQSGYRALTKSLAKSVVLAYDDFQVEAEMTVEALEKGFSIAEVPISYRKRIGKTKLNPLVDGWKIGLALVRFLRDYKPLKFFWSLSAASLAISLVFFYRVFTEFLDTGKVKLIGSALLSGVLFLLAIELLIAGLLADLLGQRLKKMAKHLDY
ncbi:MAG: glycosyltransferase [Candidatus Aenigmarchaeota archaeon]|nr:glycosyltransferase [Candidatus Aenigmarchaeota archaeon]